MDLKLLKATYTVIKNLPSKTRCCKHTNGLTHLNTAQREQIINKITNSKPRSEVAENLNNAQALDQAMKSLENVVAESNNEK